MLLLQKLLNDLPLEMLESVLMRAFLAIYMEDFESTDDEPRTVLRFSRSRDSERRAFTELSSVCSHWYLTLTGWPQSPTAAWVRHQLSKMIKSEDFVFYGNYIVHFEIRCIDQQSTSCHPLSLWLRSWFHPVAPVEWLGSVNSISSVTYSIPFTLHSRLIDVHQSHALFVILHVCQIELFVESCQIWLGQLSYVCLAPPLGVFVWDFYSLVLGFQVHCLLMFVGYSHIETVLLYDIQTDRQTDRHSH